MSNREALRAKYRMIADGPHKGFIIPEYHFMSSSNREVEERVFVEKKVAIEVESPPTRALKFKGFEDEADRQRQAVKRIMRKHESRKINEANKRKRLPTTFMMPFGKYQGQTLSEIFNEDPGYIKWGSEKLENLEIREKMREVLELES
jgi:uncharacterized protein (DUF3820 family)